VAIHLVRLGYRRAADPILRAKLAANRTASQDASKRVPADWTDERGKVRAYLDEAVAGRPGGRPPSLVTVAAGLADQKRQALLIGDGGAPVLRGAWERLAVAVRSLLPIISGIG
jgi:hypothetical protein